MTKREAMEINRTFDRLAAIGIAYSDCDKLRRISMTLRRWSELECGVDGGCVERDEATDKPFWHNSYTGRLTPIADRERGALRRLKALMDAYPELTYYVQGDPRGCALYILTRAQLAGLDVHAYYTRGIAVG